MDRIECDGNSAQSWKSHPIRLVSPSPSRCCGEPAIVVQRAAGGFVTVVCTKCQSEDTLAMTEFRNLAAWVSCPKCRRRMSPGLVPPKDQNYGFVCEPCKVYLWLADLLPDFRDV